MVGQFSEWPLIRFDVVAIIRSPCAAFQCDISTGTVMVSNMLRVTPPRIRSCNREWPYPPITSRPILLSAAIDRMAP